MKKTKDNTQIDENKINPQIQQENQTKQETKQEQGENQKQQENQENREQRENAGKILNSLEGNVDEVEKELEGEPEDSAAGFDPAAPLMKNRKAFFAVGLIIIILAVVGLVNVVKFTMNTVSDIANQTAIKNEFAEFIYPMVLIDTPAFDGIENIPSSVVVNAAIWRIYIYGNTEKNENDGDNMTISEIDVESSAAALFGASVKVEHQTVTAGIDVFEYSQSLKSYIVPLNLDKNTFWPKISQISSVGDTFTLTVEYMTPIMGIGNEESSSIKQMIYTVSRNASAKTIKAVQYVTVSSTE